MKKNNRIELIVAVCLLIAFGIWTALVGLIDVQPIGPEESAVGMAMLNGWFHDLTGVHMPLYNLTDWLGLLPIATAAGFAILGLIQWITRKSIKKVDRSILVLGGFYIAVAAAYGFFEVIPVNFRPVLIEGELEASYPSSTTLLSLCVMPTAMMQLWGRIPHKGLRWGVEIAIGVFTLFMVIVRLICGVHWLTDILGGILLSGALVTAYHAVAHSRK